MTTQHIGANALPDLLHGDLESADPSYQASRKPITALHPSQLCLLLFGGPNPAMPSAGWGSTVKPDGAEAKEKVIADCSLRG